MIKVLALALVAVGTAHAQEALTNIPAKSPTSAYLQDGRGVIARSGTGMCWRSGSWTPADAVPGCDGELAPPIANPIAPPLASAAPAPAPAPAARQRCDFSYTLGGDEAFAFGRNQLGTAARQKLDRELTSRLAECDTVESILITGHTDRLGAPRQNQKLSERRALAVEGYLRSRGVTAPIETLGAGATAQTKACPDVRPTRKLKECLAPNRRVVIDVRGVKK